MNKPEKDFRRSLPCSIELEQAAIGACLVDNRLIEVLAADLEPEALFDPLHQRIYGLILALSAEGKVDPLILNSVMAHDDGLKIVGGIGYLANLAQAAPARPNVTEYARALKELAQRRRLIEIGESLLDDAYAATGDRSSDELVTRHADALLRIGEGRKTGTKHLADVVTASLTQAEKHLAGEKIAAVETGIGPFDRAIGGLQPGDRVAIAARTGMGKSLTASAIANGLARNGAPVFIASGDMRAKQWGDRAACDVESFLHPGEPYISYSKFRAGLLSNKEIYRLALAQHEMQAWAIDIDDNPTINVATFRGRVREMARRYPGQQGVAILDFIQKVKPEKGGKRDQRRDEDLTEISYDLGDICGELGWSLIALVQLKNKATDAKGQLSEAPPSVADIRESGGIEMAFDIIVSPFRKAFFIERREPEGKHNAGGPPPEWISWNAEMAEHRNKLRLLGWKNRDGNAAVLNLDLWCNPATATVCEYAPERSTQQTADLLAFGAPG